MTGSIEQPFIVGVDGCPAGWLAVRHALGEPQSSTFEIHKTFAGLLEACSPFAALAVDIPIGIPSHIGPGGRLADRAARAVLGARQSSVFAIPSRRAVTSTDYRNACQAALETSDPPRKVSKQAFNIFPKIREVDAVMTPKLQATIVECHPEVAFWAMNGNQPLSEPKKVKSRPYGPGLELRRNLLASAGFRPEFLAGLGLPAKIAGADDLLDACATAWTAARLACGTASRFPTDPATDEKGLRMEIVY